MKTTIDIPEDLLKDVISYTGAKTKREAVVTALEQYNRRQRVDAFIKRIKENPLELRSNEEIEAADVADAERFLSDYQSR